MAQITNGSIAEARKKDLYDHVSFDALYGYNEPIGGLRDAGNRMFSQVITEGVCFWKEMMTRNMNPTEIKMHNGASFDTTMSPGTPYWAEIVQKTENDPTQIAFTLIEYVDSIDVTPEEPEEMVKILRSYIDLGLYPLVASPLSFSNICACFEKYEEVKPNFNIIGTVVDVNLVGNRIFLTVMWTFEFANAYRAEAFSYGFATASMTSMVQTPAPWREANMNEVTNIGVPVLTLQPHTAHASVLSYATGGSDVLNELIVSGGFDLKYINFLMEQLHEAKTMLDTPKAAAPVQHEPASTVVPEPNGVPVHDASKDDLFGRRMHLYDSIPNLDEDDEPDPFSLI